VPAPSATTAPGDSRLAMFTVILLLFLRRQVHRNQSTRHAP
jgi:hypothetical protein